MSAHPFDLIRVYIGRSVFNGRWKIENDLILNRGLPDVGDCLTDFQGEIEFRAGETLRRILKAHLGPGGCQRLGVLLDPLRSPSGDLDNLSASSPKDVPALR